MNLPQTDNYQELFLNDIPLIDVRAPVEFSQGAFPMASNLPLMNDEERHQVGIRYKEQGQEMAIELGHDLVKDEIKQQRVSDWSEFTRQYPQGALYCFRGGLRSKISQQWIFETTGTYYPRVEGGYKAMRGFLLAELERATGYFNPTILGGRTGSGKTLLLDKLKRKIDLEKIFKHRGSAFGRYATAQPSQIDAENRLAIELLKHRHHDAKNILIEDEAASIGSRRIPDSFYACMKQSPLIILQTTLLERVNNIYDEYILESLLDYRQLHGNDKGFELWAENLLASLEKVQRRLGGPRYNTASSLMNQAIAQHRQSEDTQGHKDWIEFMLTEYYDPMYDYQLSKKTERVIFSGDEAAVLEFLSQQFDIL